MEKYFGIAYKEALKAYKKDEIPVGAVIVKNDKIIAKSHNDRQKKHKIIGHAEINVILKAEKKLNDWRLDGCELYVTLEPCNMCDVIIKESRITKVHYLITNPQKNSTNKKQTIFNNEISIKYQKLLTNFFENLRNKDIK